MHFSSSICLSFVSVDTWWSEGGATDLRALRFLRSHLLHRFKHFATFRFIVIYLLLPFTMAATRLAVILLCTLLLVAAEGQRFKKQKFVAPGQNPDMFPDPTFDDSLAECSRKEPCGYYGFSLHDRSKVHWVQSWCRCSSSQECVYGYTDMRMHVYKHYCVNRDEIPAHLIQT
ncbi:hypothetical protein L596_029179 [Steinernema carpocapsae]|uniref:Uncharacterized protein n=1 Tax=Steinernema carpocapsae TaxID=34508 RepID=A0A4U5LTW4_STECR|nr:hypothetical protein L596_029179 [Steinernema carpocapsae]